MHIWSGHEHLSVDGTLIATDPLHEPGPVIGRNGKPIDLWWSGRHRHHGGNVQVITAPDGWPIWSSDVRPGREHDIAALRAHTSLREVLLGWVSHDLPVLTDLGYEGESGMVTVAIKKLAGGQLTAQHKTANKAHNSKRAIGERGNSLLKTNIRIPAASQPVPLANRRDRRRCPGPATGRTSPDHMNSRHTAYPERLTLDHRVVQPVDDGAENDNRPAARILAPKTQEVN